MIGLKHIFQKNEIAEYIGRPVVTKENGSWAILFIPMITGTFAALNHNISAIILSFVCIFFAFMSYVPAQIIISNGLRNLPVNKKYYSSMFWLTVYFLICSLTGIYLIFHYNRPILFLFAATAFFFFAASMLIVDIDKKNVWSDLLAVMGLTLSAPAMMYILDGKLNGNNLFVWILNVLFFGSSTVYVHMKIKASALKKNNLTLSERMSIGKINLIYHLIVISLLVLYTIYYPTKELIVVAYIPIVIHALIGTFKYAQKTNFRKLGYALLVYSVVFAVIIFMSIK